MNENTVRQLWLRFIQQDPERTADVLTTHGAAMHAAAGTLRRHRSGLVSDKKTVQLLRGHHNAMIQATTEIFAEMIGEEED